MSVSGSFFMRPVQGVAAGKAGRRGEDGVEGLNVWMGAEAGLQLSVFEVAFAV